MSKVFITGGMGFVGSHVVRRLVSDGHEVVIFDNLVHYSFRREPEPDYFQIRLADLFDRVTIIRGNTANLDFLRRTIMEQRPRHIIHMAAMPLATLSISHPEEAFESILQGTMNLLQVCRDLPDLERFLLISSSMVYGDFVKVPAEEDQRTQPKEVYGGLKLCSEVTTRTFGNMYGIPYTIVRPTAVYGPTDLNRRVLAIFLDRAMAGQPIKVKGSDQRLDFTFVEDTAAGIVAAAFGEQGVGEVFNISRGEGRSLLEAAEIVRSLVPGTEIIIDEPDARYPKRGALDITKARELLGYSPGHSLEDGLERYHDFLVRAREQVGRLPPPPDIPVLGPKVAGAGERELGAAG